MGAEWDSHIICSRHTKRGRNDFDVDNVNDRIHKLIAGLSRRSIRTGSLVILCHDTSVEDAQAVEEDIIAMERLASQHAIKVEYHTMSGLYSQVVKN